MKKPKSLFALVGLLSVCAGCLFISSCQDEVNDTTEAVYDDGKSASTFMSALDVNLNSFMDASVTAKESGVKTRVSLSTKPTVEDLGVTRVYVDLSLAEKPVNLKTISTPRHIMQLINDFGGEISLVNDGTFNDSFELSNEECMNALDPLIQESKEYLYNKGFSEVEIQEMLAENNVDESALVPFVSTLTEEEQSQIVKNTQPISRKYVEDIDWNKAGKCALNALGFDAIYALSQSTASQWSKRVLKQVFKTVAKKMVGPVGAAIAVIEFSICYWG